MFPVSSLDALADDQSAPLFYIPVPEGGPDGIEVAPDGAIHFNTVGALAGLKDPADGGMYRLTKEDFMSGHLPAPFAQNTNSVMVTPPRGVPMMLTYDQDIKLAGPSDIAVRKMSDGSYLLVIPELAPTSPNNHDNQVTVIRLPANFDQF